MSDNLTGLAGGLLALAVTVEVANNVLNKKRKKKSESKLFKGMKIK